MAAASHGMIRRRVIILFLLVTFLLTGLCLRLGYLQLFRSSWLSENATDQRIRNIPVEGKRGLIFDRKGRELAVSKSIESVYAIPAEIKDVQDTAAKLAAILNLQADDLSRNLAKRQAFVWVKRKVEPALARKIQESALIGVGITQEGQRYYPNDEIAAHVLGFTGIDSQGLDGVEMTFDSELKGTPGRILVEYDARGREIPYANHRFIPPEPGNNIYLTIDLVVQKIVERELDQIMTDTQAAAATVVALEPATGKVLAMANRPTYNPNHFGDYAPKFWRNLALSNAYEPGSTFKIVTAAAALNEKVVTLQDRFYDPGAIDVQGRQIHCWKEGGHGSESFAEVVQNSCNVGFVNVGLRLGRDSFYQYLEKSGFGHLTEIALPGEAKGIVIDKKDVKPINIATLAMGQSIAVTPLQLASAVGAIVNDGNRLRPQIVEKVVSKDGRLVREIQPESLGQVINFETSAEVRGVLEKVVELGTGRNAFLAGYSVGGKTGTAQKVGAGGYMAGKYVASFIGFAPVQKPQIVLLILIDEPMGLYYGGQIAAPAFAAMMKDILPYLQIPKMPDKQ
ncbi:MAG: penicillin-binding transpeptidase domain-containing protein [Sporomusaceae bacterium]|nr:penicillin-binding transpeptidase domain-containing protein [Sporomusaceae bacterium]